jgi:hypothetical protein
VHIRGSGQSAAHDDQWVRCTCSKGEASYDDTDDDYESREPCTAPVQSFSHNDWDTGFSSEYIMRLKDQFLAAMPECPVNEEYGAAVNDQENNWGVPDPNAVNADEAGEFGDQYAKVGGTPTALNPQDPLGTEKVKHAQQTYRAGTLEIGEGLVVKVHTVQMYRDHGAQE